ncbi:MAG: hypothetical protein P4L85_00820 [Paludisphaera borealis]|uniref:hypothetical protein n=1 Tax=Paludisphaera borealis TaxID=1387353 RepID=UPI00284CE89D|nr:hypothetical protein [Paludisphaera borealis]MDR3617863.1 hypothetical protein [Paludisphaera borealis]
MSLFARLLQAVGSWRRRRGSLRTVRNAGIAMEQLDHRQMLSVTFTGNVPIDFPATQSPGVVILPDNANVQHPVIGNAALKSLVKVSGFDINGLRVSYSPDNNGTLSIGIDQPPSLNHPGAVIAGDADNNGNSGSVNPAVTALGLGVQDPATFGGTEYMGVYLDFLGTGTAQIVAGFPQTPPPGVDAKVFQVATANQAGPNVAPTFGTPLPQFQGNIYTQNDPAHPNMELSIVNFNTLYQTITGESIAPTAVFNVGAFAGSSVDGPISEAFFPEQPVLLSAATPPVTPPVVCPPISPPILINPHEHRIIDNAHRDLVRVYIQGTSGFDPATIDPSTVDFAGAKPIATLPHRFPRSPFLGQTFVFNAKDIQADPGLQTLTFTAKTFDGQDVVSSNQVVNIPYASQRAGNRLGFLMNRNSKIDTQYTALRKLAVTNPSAILDPTAVPASSSSVSLDVASPSLARNVNVDYTPQVTAQGTVTPVAAPREVVTLPTAKNASKLTGRLHRTLEDYLAQSTAPTGAAAVPLAVGGAV